MPFDEMNEDHGGGGDGRHAHVNHIAGMLLSFLDVLCGSADTCEACTAQALAIEVVAARARALLERDGEDAVVADLMELVECVLANVGIEAQTDYRRAPE